MAPTNRKHRFFVDLINHAPIPNLPSDPPLSAAPAGHPSPHATTARLRIYHKQPPDPRAQQHRHDTLRLYFAFNSYTVDTQKDSAQWQSFFRWTEYTRKRVDTVFVTGYTDTVGTTAYNRALSFHRAAAAAYWIDSQLRNTTLHPAPGNIPFLDIAGHGKAPTIQYSDSANRRAEIILSYTSAEPPTPIAAAPTNTVPPPIVITLHHINFEMDTPIPTGATILAMPGNVQVLLQYKDRRMEIDGYVNSITPLHGEKDPLFILSVKRAKYIYDYLINAGFDPAKLSYKGMGNATPVNPDPTNTEEMSANMRVEIKIF